MSNELRYFQVGRPAEFPDMVKLQEAMLDLEKDILEKETPKVKGKVAPKTTKKVVVGVTPVEGKIVQAKHVTRSLCEKDCEVFSCKPNHHHPNTFTVILHKSEAAEKLLTSPLKATYGTLVFTVVA